MISEGNWTTVLSVSGRTESIAVALPSPADLCLVRVVLATANPDWHRAGWVKQYGTIDGDRYLLKTNSIELDGELTEIYPIANSEILFTPVPWLGIWEITVKARLIL